MRVGGRVRGGGRSEGRWEEGGMRGGGRDEGRWEG